MDFIYGVYGLTFIVLGVVVLLQPREDSAYPLARFIWLLGLFGLLRGSEIWLHYLGLPADTTPLLDGVRTVALLGAYLALLEFGTRLLLAVQELELHRLGGTLRRLHRWLYPVLLIVVTWAALAQRQGWLGLEQWSGYLLGFPAALLTAAGFVRYYRAERAVLEHLPVRASFYLAGFALAAWGVVSALFGRSGPLPPGSFLNGELITQATGIAVEYFRVTFAALTAIAVGNILRIFSFETQGKLRGALGSLQRTLAEVRELSSRNDQVLSTIGEGIVGVDAAGRITFANPAALNMLGYSEDQVIGKPMHTLLHHTRPDGSAFPRSECPICSALESETTLFSEAEHFWRRDGTSFPVEFTRAPFTGTGTDTRTVVAFRDISERREADKRLRLAAKVIETTPEGIIVTDPQGTIISVNPTFLSSMGYQEQEVLGRNPSMFHSDLHDSSFYAGIWEAVNRTGQWQGEIWNRRKSGANYPEWLTISAIRDEQGKITNYVGIYSDINAQNQLQEHLHHLAYYDALTELPNRYLFGDHLDLALVQARREGKRVALMFLDIDQFKNINDTLGHSVGDQVLARLADRLRQHVRESDTVSRLGGDEFTVILPNITETRHAAIVAQKVLEGLRQPLALDGREFLITASIGVSLFPDDADNPETLIRNADTALYRAKEAGRNNYQFYTPDMSVRFQERVAMEDRLRKAIADDALQVVYQPQYDLTTGRMVGVEALARWHNDELGDVPPSIFIPMAEDSGLIAPVGEWVLRSACEQAKEWNEAGGKDFRVAVNLSGHQLRQSGLVQLVSRVLQETGCKPEHLELELTESVLMEHKEPVISTLKALNEMGIRISVDDFGTGYCSLSYLKQFAIDKLKIAQIFVHDVPESINDSVIATTIIAMAHTLKLKVIAEGVENQSQLTFLRARGCDEIQGFLFARPAPASEISKLLG